nr:hypothetical protein GCM10025699_32050 [Microbacterium flavescens]
MSARETGLALYDRTARDAAATVISRYSTSFSLACRLLGPRPRPHVRDVYALVRVADEIVDGPAEAAGLSPEAAGRVLDELETETLAAVESGFSANLVVHAFAGTARECGIGGDLIRPFFASMRTDLSTSRHDGASHDAYVYGSAEVVGLMCLQVFVNAGAPHPIAPSAELVDGARRLGAAFQDVNFLRDLDHDATALGRDYLDLDSPGSSRTAVLDRIDADLAAAARSSPSPEGLPARGDRRARPLRGAVRAAAAVSAGGTARARPGSGQGAARGARVARLRTARGARMSGGVPRTPGTAVVVGGGIAGLATAALLGAEGWRVTVLEARDVVGGRAGSWDHEGFRFDTGPSWYLMPEVFDHFFRLLGTTAERELDLVPLDPAYRVYSDPATCRAPLDVRSGRRRPRRSSRAWSRAPGRD